MTEIYNGSQQLVPVRSSFSPIKYQIINREKITTMAKLILLKFERGNFQEGFEVSLQKFEYSGYNLDLLTNIPVSLGVEHLI